MFKDDERRGEADGTFCALVGPREHQNAQPASVPVALGLVVPSRPRGKTPATPAAMRKTSRTQLKAVKSPPVSVTAMLLNLISSVDELNKHSSSSMLRSMGWKTTKQPSLVTNGNNQLVLTIVSAYCV